MQKMKNLFIVFILIGFLFILGTSYAIWQMTFTQKESNLVNTTCFKIEFKEENDIILQNAYPITDAEGMSLTPYTFTIENICDTNATYQINLENLQGDGKRLSDEYLKLSLNDEKGKSLNTLPEVLTTLSNANVSHKLSTGMLKVGEKKEFLLRLWMDHNTPAIDEVMNATHESKVTVILIHKETIPDVITLAREYLDGISVQNTVSNLGNDVLTYFYKLDDGDEKVSDDANYTFTGLNDGTYKVSVRIENQDGIIIKEETKDVVIAYEHVYVSSSGNDTTGIGSMVNPYATLQPAYNKVKSGGEILLLSDITATSTTNMNIENKSVTLKSSGDNSYSIFRGDALKTAIIDVNNTNTLTTANIILNGKNIDANASLIEVRNAELNIYEKSIIQNNINNGKYLDDWKINFTAGGGVYAFQSVVNIRGGTIQNNTSNAGSNSSSGGGGIHVGKSTLNIYQANIINNRVIGGSAPHGGGVDCYLSTFYFYDGIISQNMSANDSGGVSVGSENDGASTMFMLGGTIQNNEASVMAGGIYVWGSQAKLYLRGGTISHNSALNYADLLANDGQIIDER